MDFYRWNISKYREKTYHLNPYQDGCYRRLIDTYMETRKPLPDNDYALARICGISIDDWMLHAASIVRAFFKQRSGMLFHETCDEELDYQDKRRKFASAKATKAANTRHNKNKGIDATSIHDECLGMLERERELRDIDTNVSISPLISPQQEKDKSDAEPKRKRKQSSFITKEFRGDFESISLAEQLRVDFEPEQQKFIDYWLGKGKSMSDWQATFRNWIRNAAKYRDQRAEGQSFGRQNIRDVTGAALRAAEARRQAINRA